MGVMGRAGTGRVRIADRKRNPEGNTSDISYQAPTKTNPDLTFVLKKQTKIFECFGPNCSKKKRWRSYREEGVFPGKGAVSTDRSGTPLEECLLGYPGDYMARINDSQTAGPCHGITVNVLGILAVPRALFMAAAHTTCPYSCSCSCL